jgi:alpha-tubulin suppressor-like RCC1 family protein
MKNQKAIGAILTCVCVTACGAEDPTAERRDPLPSSAVLSADTTQTLASRPILTLRHLSAVAAGAFHTCARIRIGITEGAVRCWGNNSHGQLGYGNTTNVGDNETPASAGDVDVGGSVDQVAAGYWHTCALLDTGNVRCWGGQVGGVLGYGNTKRIGDDETPASAGDVPIGGSVVQISAGNDHTCVLLDTGNVRCWGISTEGELGYGNTKLIGDNETPASAGDVPVGAKVEQLTSGEFHTCALLQTGAVRCWGMNSSGQLGYGHTNDIGDNETPASAGDVPVGGKVVQIAAGRNHSCALLDTGNVRCWGAADSGQLGYGNTKSIGDSETPASAGDVPIGGKVVQIAAGWNHTCALLGTGEVRCWGEGEFGQLGYGNSAYIGDNETAAAAGSVSIGGQVTQLTLGQYHTCAMLSTPFVVGLEHGVYNAARCWGLGFDGQLGYGNTSELGNTPATVPSLIGDIQVL